jgi:hypothetical protein
VSKYRNFLFSFSLGFLISHSILMQMAFLFNMLKKPSLYLHKGLRLLNRKSTQFFLPVSFFLSSISVFLPYSFCLPISFFLSLAKHGDNQRIRIWIENNRICSAFFFVFEGVFMFIPKIKTIYNKMLQSNYSNVS